MKNSFLNHIRHVASRILHHWWPVTLCDCSVLDRNEITPFYKRGPIGKTQWVPLLPAVFLKHSCNRSSILVDSDSPHHLPESFHLGCCTWAFLDTAHPKTAFRWSRAIKFWLSDISNIHSKGNSLGTSTNPAVPKWDFKHKRTCPGIYERKCTEQREVLKKKTGVRD